MHPAESVETQLHPIILAAGIERRVPPWAVMSSSRQEHVERVAALLEAWAVELRHDASTKTRWIAAGMLHDALKGVSPSVLRNEVQRGRCMPAPLLHGPACANRLAGEGVDDTELLDAIAHHTTGYAMFGELGQALYMADSLEPGRRRRPEFRAELRERMPLDWSNVLREVAADKLATLSRRGLSPPPVTQEFVRSLA